MWKQALKPNARVVNRCEAQMKDMAPVTAVG